MYMYSYVLIMLVECLAESALLTWWSLRDKHAAVNRGTLFKERITIGKFPLAAVNVGQYVVRVIL